MAQQCGPWVTCGDLHDRGPKVQRECRRLAERGHGSHFFAPQAAPYCVVSGCLLERTLRDLPGSEVMERSL